MIPKDIIDLFRVPVGERIRLKDYNPGWAQTDMGGPHALIPVEDAVTGIIGVIDRLELSQSGSFFDWRGQLVPW